VRSHDLNHLLDEPSLVHGGTMLFPLELSFSAIPPTKDFWGNKAAVLCCFWPSPAAAPTEYWCAGFGLCIKLAASQRFICVSSYELCSNCNPLEVSPRPVIIRSSQWGDAFNPYRDNRMGTARNMSLSERFAQTQHQPRNVRKTT
jgi:hypothetical protein